MSLTVYIPRLITDEQSYIMFINCIERVNKYIKGFDNMQIIVLCDNETELTKIGDPLLQKEYNNITRICRVLSFSDVSSFRIHGQYIFKHVL